MIYFAIPGMYENSKINILFLDFMKQNPNYFYDDIGINAVYGNFQFNIFDGGRVFSNYTQTTKEEIEYLKKIYNEQFNLSLRQIFTNNQLTPKDYTNRFANLCLTLCEDEKNEIVLVDDGLKEYIATNYPKYSFISSTTKCLNKEQTLKELEREDFKLVCLDYNLNSNINFLSTIKNSEKCELLINAICPPGCPNRKEHYKLNSLSHLNYGQGYAIPCSIINSTVNPKTMASKNNLSYNDIKNIYEPMGYKYFKLEGRTLSPIENLCNYVNYMVKPEYHLEVITKICNIYYGVPGCEKSFK